MRFLLVVYDNQTYTHEFPIGLGYIAGTLKSVGVDVVVYSQDLHHYPDEHLTDYLNKNKFDYVGVSVIGGYYQYAKLLKISAAINASKQRPIYIIGGHGPTPDPQYFIKKTGADFVIMGEGEKTIKELVCNGYCTSGFAVDGLTCRRRPLIKDIDNLPFPAYELFPIEYYRQYRYTHCKPTDFTMSMISGRGCIFKCNFCYRMDEGFRARSDESIIEEINLLKTNYGINYISFSDELLMSSVERTESLCQAFINSGVQFHWRCNGRLNFASLSVLNLMRKAGCVFINYGIEAMDDKVLRDMNKCLTVKQIVEGIENTLKAGISPGFNIIYGHIGDTKETLDKAVAFLLRYDDGAQLRTIRPVTPYPGSPLYYKAIKEGLLKDCEDFYTKHTNSDLLSVNFTGMTDKEFYDNLWKANNKLIKNYYQNKLSETLNTAKKLYLEKDKTFRGFR